MHGSWIHDGAGGKAGKFVLVAGLHVLVAVGVMHVMNAKTISLPAIFDAPMVWTTPEIAPPPPEPPKPQVRSAPPDIVVLKVERTFQPAMHGSVAEAGWAKLAYVWTLE